MTKNKLARPTMCSKDHIRGLAAILASAFTAFLVAGCSHDRPLPEAKGALRQMNLGSWTPEPFDLKGKRSPYPIAHPTTER